MVRALLGWAFSVFICRAFFTSYKSGVSKEPYLSIKNKTLAKILIDGWAPFEKKNSLKKDRNKLSLYGLVGYSLNLVALALIALFFAMPKIPCEPRVFTEKGYSFFIDTVNELIPYVTVALIILIEFTAVCIIMALDTAKKNYSKRTKYLFISVFSAVAVVFIIAIILLLLSI